MALIEFKNLPDTSTPLTAENLNNNFTECNNIIESGSNSNGSYIKYSDGTMVCYGIISSSVSGGHTTASGGMYMSSEVAVTYPQRFYNTGPNIYLNIVRNASDNPMAFMFCRSNGVTGFTAWSAMMTSSSSTGFTRTYMAIGRWKA